MVMECCILSAKKSSHTPATASSLRLMAERLRRCVVELDDVADFMEANDLRELGRVSVSTAMNRVENLEAFARKVNLHRKRTSNVLREEQLRRGE